MKKSWIDFVNESPWEAARGGDPAALAPLAEELADAPLGRCSLPRFAAVLASCGVPLCQSLEECLKHPWSPAGASVRPLGEMLAAFRAEPATFSGGPPSDPGLPPPPHTTPLKEWLVAAFAALEWQATEGVREACAGPPDECDIVAVEKLVRGVADGPRLLAEEHRHAVFDHLAGGLPVPREVLAAYPQTLPTPEPVLAEDGRLSYAPDGRWWAFPHDGRVLSGRVVSQEAEVDLAEVIADLVRRAGSSTSHPFSTPPGRPLVIAMDGQTRYKILPDEDPLGCLCYRCYSFPPDGHNGKPCDLPECPTYDDAVRLLAGSGLLGPSCYTSDPLLSELLYRKNVTADSSLAETEGRARDMAQAAPRTLPTRGFWESLAASSKTEKGVRTKVTIKLRDGDREVPCVLYGTMAVHRSIDTGKGWSVSHLGGAVVRDGVPTRSMARALACHLRGVLDCPDVTTPEAMPSVVAAAGVVRAFNTGQPPPPPPPNPGQHSLFGADPTDLFSGIFLL